MSGTYQFTNPLQRQSCDQTVLCVRQSGIRKRGFRSQDQGTAWPCCLYDFALQRLYYVSRYSPCSGRRQRRAVLRSPEHRIDCRWLDHHSPHSTGGRNTRSMDREAKKQGTLGHVSWKSTLLPKRKRKKTTMSLQSGSKLLLCQRCLRRRDRVRQLRDSSLDPQG